MTKFLMVLSIALAANSFAASKKATKGAAAKPAAAKPAAETKAATKVETAAPETRSDAVSAPANVAPHPTSASEGIATPTASTATVNIAKPSDTAITGTLDIRPSWGSKAGEVHTENWVDLGYKSGNYHLIYEQDFNTNIYSPGKATSGMDLTLIHGFIRAKANDVWVSPSKTYTLSLELRPFVPTYKVEREKGMITIVRAYAKFAAKVSDAVTLSAWEVPIAHVYDRAGNNVGGALSANRVFENRVYLMADWNITDKWALNFPIWISNSKFRNYANNVGGNWDNSLWTYPELDYAINNNYTLGLSWYNNDSFFNSDFSDSNFKQAFEGGITQVVFRATL